MKHPEIGKLYRLANVLVDTGDKIKAYKEIPDTEGILSEAVRIEPGSWALCISLEDYGWVKVLYNNEVVEVHEMYFEFETK